MTSTPLTDLAGERLVRKAPDRVLPLDQGDLEYIGTALAAIETAFGIHAQPGVPLAVIPGRALMRQLVDLRRQLKPRSPEQTEAWGRLAGAILILDMASDFANQHSEVEGRRRLLDHDDLDT
jgi:hypothetical protein